MFVFFISLWAFLVAATAKAFANPACVVCTVAFAGALEAANVLDLPYPVVGVWMGGLLLMTFYFSVKLFDKLLWNFAGYRLILAILTLAIIPALYKYMKEPLAADKFLYSMLAGAAVFELSQRYYQRVKRLHGGRAHFPFEKVVFAVVALCLTSLGFYYG